MQNLGEKFKIQYVLTDIKYNDENEIIYLNIGKKLNGKIEDFIVKDTNGIGETTILYNENNKTGKINSVIYSKLNYTSNNKIEKANNSYKDNIYEVNEYIFNKKSTESEIMNTLDKMSNKFEVKLYLKSIFYNKDKEITKLIIFYQDKLGKKDTFETMNNEGIDDVFVGLRRKKNKNAEYKIHTLGGKNSKKVGYSVNQVRKLNEQELAQYEKDMKQYEVDMKQHEKDIKQHEIDMKQHEIDMRQHKIDMKQHEIDMKQHEKDVKQHKIDMIQHKKDMVQYEKDKIQYEKDLKQQEIDRKQHEIEIKKIESEKKQKVKAKNNK